MFVLLSLQKAKKTNFKSSPFINWGLPVLAQIRSDWKLVKLRLQDELRFLLCDICRNVAFAFSPRKRRGSWLRLNGIFVNELSMDHQCRDQVSINRWMAFKIAKRGCANAFGVLIKTKAYEQWFWVINELITMLGFHRPLPDKRHGKLYVFMNMGLALQNQRTEGRLSTTQK